MCFFCQNKYYFILELPQPSDIRDVDAEKIAEELGDISHSRCFVSLVSVDVESYAKEHFEKPVKKTLTIPSWLNELGMKKNVNFSQVLTDALKKKLLPQSSDSCSDR